MSLARPFGLYYNLERPLGLYYDHCVSLALHLGMYYILFLGIWGAKAKYVYGSEEIVLRDLGRSMHYFQVSREHRHPRGAHEIYFGDIAVI